MLYLIDPATILNGTRAADFVGHSLASWINGELFRLRRLERDKQATGGNQNDRQC